MIPVVWLQNNESRRLFSWGGNVINFFTKNVWHDKVTINIIRSLPALVFFYCLSWTKNKFGLSCAFPFLSFLLEFKWSSLFKTIKIGHQITYTRLWSCRSKYLPVQTKKGNIRRKRCKTYSKRTIKI